MIINKNSLKTKAMQKAAKYLELELGNEGTEIVFTEDTSINGLKISKKGDTISITYSKYAYAFRALSLIFEQQENEYEISETASFKTNGYMPDCSRNAVINVEELKDLILKMSLMGHSMLMLYTEDTYEIENNPYFGYMRGRYTKEEIRELDEYAEQFGIELVPAIQTLAHLSAILRWNTYLPIVDCADILLAGEDKTYELIEEMIKSCRSMYKTKQINIGMDEAGLLGCGAYREKHGFTNRFDIMCEHLRKVNEICKKYDFQPMMWSDMFFHLISGVDVYKKEFNIEPEMLEKIPSDVKLIFWDYYHRDREAYDNNVAKHKAFKNETVFAGGAWKWSGYAPANWHSVIASKLALDACRGNMDTVFTTGWGDNGGDASCNCINPIIQLFAEYDFDENLTDEKLAKRFKTCFKCDINDFLMLDKINQPEGFVENQNSNPSKYLLFNDVLCGLFDKHATADFEKYYAKMAMDIEQAQTRTGEYSYMFNTLATLCRVLELKADVGNKIKAAYDAGDKKELKNFADKVLPEIVSRTITFKNALKNQWMKENNPFGFEVQDIRVGGVIIRTNTAIDTINDYLSGKIEKIGQLEEERLYFDGEMREDGAQLSTSNNLWDKMVSGSRIAGI